jgi:hypothetical protein
MLSVLKYFWEILFQISLLLLPQMKSERWDEEKLESYQPTCCVWSFINIWEEPALPSNVISWHTQKINRICDGWGRREEVKWLCQVMSTKFVSIASVSRSKTRCRSTWFASLSLPRFCPKAFPLVRRFHIRMETIFSILHGAKFANSPLSRDKMSQLAWATRLPFFDQEKTICAKRRTKRFNYIN